MDPPRSVSTPAATPILPQASAVDQEALAGSLALAVQWKTRARLARQARRVVAVEALGVLVGMLHRQRLVKHRTPECAGTLFISALFSGIIVVMRFFLLALGLLFIAFMVALFVGMVIQLLKSPVNCDLPTDWARVSRVVIGVIAVPGLIYLCFQGWIRLGRHLIIRALHQAKGLAQLGLLLGLTIILWIVLLGRLQLQGIAWTTVIGYAVALSGCFLRELLVFYDGQLVELELGEHDDNLYRLAFALHAIAAVEHIVAATQRKALQQLCKTCLVHFECYHDALLNLTYLRCQSCRRVYDGTQVLEGQPVIVAVLDQGWPELEQRKGQVLYVNALRRSQYFHFDKVLIQKADDAMVERFVMRMINESDAARAMRFRGMVCHVQQELALSAHTLNLLRHSFGPQRVYA